MPYMDFKTACDKQLAETRQKLAVFQTENNTSETFNLWAQKQIELDYYNALLSFLIIIIFEPKSRLPRKRPIMLLFLKWKKRWIIR